MKFLLCVVLFLATGCQSQWAYLGSESSRDLEVGAWTFSGPPGWVCSASSEDLPGPGLWMTRDGPRLQSIVVCTVPLRTFEREGAALPSTDAELADRLLANEALGWQGRTQRVSLEPFECDGQRGFRMRLRRVDRQPREDDLLVVFRRGADVDLFWLRACSLHFFDRDVKAFEEMLRTASFRA